MMSGQAKRVTGWVCGRVLVRQDMLTCIVMTKDEVTPTEALIPRARRLWTEQGRRLQLVGSGMRRWSLQVVQYLDTYYVSNPS